MKKKRKNEKKRFSLYFKSCNNTTSDIHANAYLRLNVIATSILFVRHFMQEKSFLSKIFVYVDTSRIIITILFLDPILNNSTWHGWVTYYKVQ